MKIQLHRKQNDIKQDPPHKNENDIQQNNSTLEKKHDHKHKNKKKTKRKQIVTADKK